MYHETVATTVVAVGNVSKGRGIRARAGYRRNPVRSIRIHAPSQGITNVTVGRVQLTDSPTEGRVLVTGLSRQTRSLDDNGSIVHPKHRHVDIDCIYSALGVRHLNDEDIGTTEVPVGNIGDETRIGIRPLHACGSVRGIRIYRPNESRVGIVLVACS